MNKDKPIGQRLSEAAGRLNVAIERAERVLNEANFGTTASVRMTDESSLCFGKRGGNWILVVERDGRETPLLSTSRETRTMAVLFLDGLYGALEERAHVECAAVELAISAAESFNRSRSRDASSPTESADMAADPER